MAGAHGFALLKAMKIKRLKTLTLIGLASFLTAFSGQEKFVELEGYLNGRDSAKFRRIDNNVRAVLSKGTRGEILESKKMASGNYGLKVRVMSGDKTGRSYWIYYNVNNPDVKLYDSAPQAWNEVDRLEVKKVEQADGVETVRATPAIDETDAAADALYKETLPAVTGKEDAQVALDAISSGMEAIKNVPIPTTRPECKECSVSVTAAAEADDVDTVDVTRGAIQMNPRCATFINRHGEFGRLGKKAMSIMSQPKYIDLFTKNNALGDYCPRFNQLADSEKLQAWTWYWGSLANEETQCLIDIVHQTHTKTGARLNPTVGYGLFAAEKDDYYRVVTQGRGRACKDIKTGEGQLLCAIDTMAMRTLDRGRNARNDGSIYWGPSRPYKCDKKGRCKDRGLKQMMPHMKRFKACF